MKIDVRFRGLQPGEANRERVAQRVHLHLSRFGREVASAIVRLGDLNGPRGGVDKRVQVTVTGARIGAVTTEERHTDAHAALDVAIGRVARTVRRALERAREPLGPGAATARRAS